ncbi:MAG: hypothetical protein IJ622_07110 [Bacteroidales bacterium]|nr:hypothetical protein [Bacteroidales bacterium]
MDSRKRMKKIGGSILTVTMLLLCFLPGCGKKETESGRGTITGMGARRIVERIIPVDDALLPLIDCYTSGAIVEGNPIVVRFSNPETMKVKYGDPIPAKAFSFKPALKGKAVWIDENTVGFQYDNIDKDQNYTCQFKVSEFVDVSSGNDLEFGFGVRRQNFSLVSAQPLCTSSDKMDYILRVAFATPVGADEAIKLFDEAFRKNYSVEVTDLGNNLFDFELQDLKRQNAETKLHVTLDGKAVDCKTKMERDLTLYAKDAFEPVLLDVDKSASQATLFFSQPLKENQNLDGFVSFDQNKLGYKVDIKDNRMDFYFDKSNLYDYQLKEIGMTVGSGIRAANGMVLQDDSHFDFDLTENLPKVRWTDDGVIIPDVEETTVYFDAICLNSVTLRIVRIFDENILSFLQDNELDETYGVRKAGRLEKKVRLAIDNPYVNQWKTFPIVLSDYIKVEPGAMYQLSLNFGPADYAFATDEMANAVIDDPAREDSYWDGNRYDYREYRYDGDWDDPNGFSYYNYVEEKKNIVVSDLAVTAKMGRDDVVDVLVFNISDATPAAGAKVTAYNFQKQELAQGTTDAQGGVQLQCANRPAFVVATDKKGSKSVMKLSDGNALSYSRFDVSGEPVEKGVSAFAYSNRGVWRPGDEMQLNLMLNDMESALPEGYPVVLEVIDATGRLYAKQVNTKPVNDIYCFSVPTHVADETGLWTARYKVGTSTITQNLRVETVKPNRLEIQFDLPEVVSLSKNEQVNLMARWLNGMKASGLKAEVDVKLRGGQTTFKKFKNYTFVNETQSFEPREMALFSGQLNAEGVTHVGFAPLKEVYASQMMNGTFTVKVFEQGGDFSIASFKTQLSPYERYVGVDLPETTSKYGSYYDTNKDWKFNIAVVDEDGTTCRSSVTLDYALYKLDSYWWWSGEDLSDLQRYASGTYKSSVKSGTLTCNGTTSVTFNIPNDKWGSYLFVVNDKQGGNMFAKVITFDWGYGHSSSASGAPAQLSLKTSAESYQVGENIAVTFPANEKAKALVTVEANDRVLQTMLVENLGQEGKVEIKATEKMIPNVYVYVALIQPHDANNDMPIRLYGVVPVKVENKKLQLQPSITVPETANTKKKIEVKVGEAAGQAMTYTLAVVDEGILGLTNFKTPNPYGYFNSKQALSVRTWDNYASIVDAFSGELGSVYAIGGDGILNQEITLDNRFKAYAVTLGPFELKAGETNTHSFEVPQCSGALRFMVVAKGNGKAFGSADKRMTVVDPINLYASAPRVVAPGDELNFKVQVQAPKMKNKTLQVKFDNKNLEPVGTWPTTVQVDGKGEGLLAVRTRIPKTLGNAELNVSVTGEGYTAETSTVMPIRMPYAEHRNTITKEIEAGQTLSIPFDLAGMDGTQQGNITVSSLLPVDLFGRLGYLMDYPHGCLEQVTSKAFPQLYLNYFVQFDDKEKEAMRNNIESAIANLKAYQKSDNSMTNWVGGTYSDPWTEIYALHFLVEAQKQGYNVPQYFVDGLLNYQSSRAKQWKNNPDFKQGETIQAYRLFVLALAGKAELGAMNRFKEMEMTYPLTQALTAAAFAQTGKTTIAQNLLPKGVENERISDYYTSFGSRTRDLAFLTYTQMLCDGDAKRVQNNINSLCGMLNTNRWMDTQSTAFALFVLGKYAEKMGVGNSNLSATVKVNGEERTLNTNMASVGFGFAPKLGSNTVEIKNNTNQKMVANVFTKTAVAEYDMEESGSLISMTVNYFDKNGNVLNPANLAAGTDLRVQMTVNNPSEWQVTELALSYYLPSGWELVNDRLSGDMTGNEGAKHIDLRDDRAYFYFDLTPGAKKTFTLKANATYEGNYMIPAVRCEDMYNAEIYYQIPARGCVVK